MAAKRPVFQAEQPAYRLTAKQDEFCRMDIGVSLYRGGIASGKTVAGITRSVLRRYQYPGTWQIIAGPSWDQVRDGTMQTLRRLLNPKCIVSENKIEHIMHLDNGSGFIFRTATDPDVFRALEVHDMYVDEIAMCSEDALDVGLGRIRLQHPDPAFKNQFWGTTTPRAKDWTLDVFGESGKPGYGVVHSTIYDNRENLPEGYIERLEEKYRGTPFFEQELLGMYVAFEGLVYPMFSAGHITSGLIPGKGLAGFGVGLDWGGTAAPTAAVFGSLMHQDIHIHEELYKVGATLQDVTIWLDEMCRKARIARHELPVWCDTTEQTSINELIRLGFSARGANKDRLTGIRLVAERLQDQSLTISKGCIYTIAEFSQYIWNKKKDGETAVEYRTNQPIDHHADAMDALRYLTMGFARITTRQPRGKPYRAQLERIRA